jgi:hypothetical protein
VLGNWAKTFQPRNVGIAEFVNIFLKCLVADNLFHDKETFVKVVGAECSLDTI